MTIELQSHYWWGLFSSLTSAGTGAFSFYPGLLNGKKTAAHVFMDKKPMKNTEKPFAGKCLFFFQGYTLQQTEIRLCRLECFGPIWSGEMSSLEEAVRDRLVVSDWSRRWSVKVGTDGACRCSAAEGLAGSWETWGSFTKKLQEFKHSRFFLGWVFSFIIWKLCFYVFLIRCMRAPCKIIRW